MSLIVVQLTTMFVYDSIDIALLTIFVGIGLLWREARAVRDRPAEPSSATPARSRWAATSPSCGPSGC